MEHSRVCFDVGKAKWSVPSCEKQMQVHCQAVHDGYLQRWENCLRSLRQSTLFPCACLIFFRSDNGRALPSKTRETSDWIVKFNVALLKISVQRWMTCSSMGIHGRSLPVQTLLTNCSILLSTDHA